MELKSEVLIITAIKRKTKAKMLESLKIGDKICLTVDASPVGSNRGTYASYIEVKNLQDGERTFFSFNQISTLYNAFELSEFKIGCKNCNDTRELTWYGEQGFVFCPYCGKNIEGDIIE